MASVAVTNTFSANTIASASEVNTNFTDITSFINNRNTGATVWDGLKVTSLNSPSVTINNSTSGSNILICQDNGAEVLNVHNGGATVCTATAGGASIAFTANNSTSTGAPFVAQDNGTAVLTVNDGGGTLITATPGGSSAPLTINNSTSSGSIFIAQANGSTIFTLSSTGALTHTAAATFNSASGTSNFQVKSVNQSNMLFVDATNDNIGIGTASAFGSGVLVIGISNATTAPSSTPTGGGVLYCQAGALKFKGSSGTITTIANA